MGLSESCLIWVCDLDFEFIEIAEMVCAIHESAGADINQIDMFRSGIGTDTSIGQFGCGQQRHTEFWEVKNTLYDARSGLAMQLSANFNVADTDGINGMIIGNPDMLRVVEFLVGCVVGPIMAHMCRVL